MLFGIIDTGFSASQLGLLLPSLLSLLASLILFQRGHHQPALLLLFLGALGLRVFMILLDPFLNDWDERYHALVAKNLIDHPFKPMLWAEPVLEYNYQAWCCNHIWLHKQPFFLWQMALSMKLLGVNEWAMRLPSALMGAVQVLIIYRIGWNLGRRSLGYIAAFLFALSYFQLEQTSGFMGREHNDVAFAFYLTAGFWALSEYFRKKQWTYLVLVGILTGIAIMTKWVIALLIFGAWGLAILLRPESRREPARYGEAALAFGIATLVALPWQLYIFARFPEEAAYVYGFHASHLVSSYSEHTGDLWFYLENHHWLYGNWMWLMILPGVLFFHRLVKPGMFKDIGLLAVILAYLVFSLAVNKSKSYVFFINFMIYFFQAAFLLGILELLRNRWPSRRPWGYRLLYFLLILTAGFWSLQHWKIEREHIYGWEVNRRQKLHNTEIYRKLDRLVPEDYVIFNCWEAQEAMFYTDRTCYFWLGPEQYHELKARGVKMAAFKDHKYPLPFYLKEDPDVLIIEEEIWLE